MVMELLRQWGHSGFMDHVAKVEEFYRCLCHKTLFHQSRIS
jgi:hypothetical protein